MSSEARGSVSKPHAQKSIEPRTKKAMATDAGSGLEKGSDSDGEKSKASKSKTQERRSSESKSRKRESSMSKSHPPTSPELKSVVQKTSASNAGSDKTPESKSVKTKSPESKGSHRSSRTKKSESKNSKSKPRTLKVPAAGSKTSSNSSGSGSGSGSSKRSNAKSTASRRKSSELRSESKPPERRMSSDDEHNRTVSFLPYVIPYIPSESEHTPKKSGKFSRLGNFLRDRVPMFSSRSSKSFSKDQSASQTPGDGKLVLPADRSSWSRSSYSAASHRLPTVNEPDAKMSLLRIDAPSRGASLTDITPMSWLSTPSANPPISELVLPPHPVIEKAPEEGSPHTMMSMSALRRTSHSEPGKRKPSLEKEPESSRSRSGSRDADSFMGGRNTKQRGNFLDRSDPDEPVPAESFVSWDVETPVSLYMAGAGPLAQPPITVMTALRRAAQKHPNKKAYGVKEHGEWQTITYQRLLETVHKAARGFVKLGLKRHHIVAILGPNSTEWVICHLAAIFAGGISAPMHVTCGDEDLIRYAKQIKCRIIVVGSAKELIRVLGFRSQLKYLLGVVQWGSEEIEKAEGVYSWKELLEIGLDVQVDVLSERAMQQAPNVCCSIVQTIGTGAPPKTVILSHDNVTWGSNAIGRYLSLNNESNGVTVCFMPLSYVLTQVMDIYIPINFGVTVYLAPDTPNHGSVFGVVREVRPTYFWAANRVYDVLLGAIETSWSRNLFRRMLKNWAIKIGLKGYLARVQNRSMPFGWKAAKSFVCGRIIKEFGLGRCALLMLTGGTVRNKVWDFFYGLNMDLLMSYGMTESIGQHTVSLSDRHRMRSVGHDIDGCTTMIEKSKDKGVGELLIKGRNLAMGYLDMKDRTLASYTEDGWFRTGDLGKLDEDGFLYIVGRIDQKINLSTGETVQPEAIEFSVYHHLPCVDYCMVVGKNRPHLALLMTLKTQLNRETGQPTSNLSEEVVRWFGNQGHRVSTIDDVCETAKKRLPSRIQEAIDRVNEESPTKSHRIIRWTFLSKQFSIESGEIGQRLEIRRWEVEEKYRKTIDSLFA